MNKLKKDLLLGQRYQLIEFLGKGGMSSVWLALDTKLNTRVALKFLSDELSTHETAIKRFKKEWMIASNLVHPNIVRVYEYHDDITPNPFYSMKYIDGDNISILSESDFTEAFKPIGYIASALNYAHQKGISHGDLRSNNILIDGDGMPFLFDFGVATIHEEVNDLSDVCHSDINSLGILMYEILLGVPPKPNEDIKNSLEAKIGKKLSSLIASMVNPNQKEKSLDTKEVMSLLLDADIRPGRVDVKIKSKPKLNDDIRAEIFNNENQFGSNIVSDQETPKHEEGVDPKTFYISLVFILALFFSVVFLLPSAVDEKTINRDQSKQGPQEEIENNDEFEKEMLLQRKIADENLNSLIIEYESLKNQGVSKWGGQIYERVKDNFNIGDEEYLKGSFISASKHYQIAFIEAQKLSSMIDDQLNSSLISAENAMKSNNFNEAIYFYDIASSIKPNNIEYKKQYQRALNLEDVILLYRKAFELNKDNDFISAKDLIMKSLNLDPEYEPSLSLLKQIQINITREQFENRMTEGFSALNKIDFLSARALFMDAKSLFPKSIELIDAFRQLDQAEKDFFISNLKEQIEDFEKNEQWELAIEGYEKILEKDRDIEFAKEGLLEVSKRSELTRKIQEYIDNYNALNDPEIMEKATTLLIEVSVFEKKPRLNAQIEELRRLLKRANTPIEISLVSDNYTNVRILKVGVLHLFESRNIKLRPGNYVAVGIRAGFRDVRVEFTVAPEINMRPVKVICEELI